MTNNRRADMFEQPSPYRLAGLIRAAGLRSMPVLTLLDATGAQSSDDCRSVGASLEAAIHLGLVRLEGACFDGQTVNLVK